jgi:tetratricopeptide (TPR) repeat protein
LAAAVLWSAVATASNEEDDRLLAAAETDQRGVVLPMSELVVSEELDEAAIGELRRMYAEGQRLLARHKPAQAEAIFDEVLGRLPLREVFYAAGLAAYDQQKYGRARSLLQEAVAGGGSEYVAAGNLLGLVCNELGLREQAIEHLERAASAAKEPEWEAIATLNTAVVRLRMGQLEGAWESADRARSKATEHGWSWLVALAEANLAAIAAAQGKLDLARRYNDSVLGLGRKKSGADARRLALINSAELERVAGRAERSEVLLQKALKESERAGDRGDHARTRLRIAALQCAAAETAEAGARSLEEVEQLFAELGMQPERARSLRERARCSERQQQWEEARRALERALELTSESDAPGDRVRIELQSAHVLEQLGQPQAARLTLDRVLDGAARLSMDAVLAEARLLAGNFALSDGRVAEARQQLEAAQAWFEQHQLSELERLATQALALCDARSGKAEEAWQAAEEQESWLLERGRNDEAGRLWFRLGRALFDAEEWGPCVEAGARAERHWGSGASALEARSMQANCLARDGRLSEAETLAVDPSVRRSLRFDQQRQRYNQATALLEAGRELEAIEILAALRLEDELDEAVGPMVLRQLVYGHRTVAEGAEAAGDDPAELRALRSALEAARELGDVDEIVRTAFLVGDRLVFAERSGEAVPFLREALAGAREREDRDIEWRASMALADASFERDPERAVDLYRAALAIVGPQIEELAHATRIRHNLGLLMIERGLAGGADELAAAEAGYRELGDHASADAIREFLEQLQEP